MEGGDMMSKLKARARPSANHKQCTYCKRMVHAYGHWMHEQSCSGKQKKAEESGAKVVPGPPFCLTCRRSFKGKYLDYNNHVAKCEVCFGYMLESQVGFECLLCAKVAPTQGGLYSHLFACHPEVISGSDQATTKSWRCDLCDKKFKLSFELKKHRPRCKLRIKSKSSSSRKNLTKKVVHPPKGGIKCRYCSRLISKSHLEHHQGICRKYRDYIDKDTCKICGKKYDSPRSMFLHIGNVHKAEFAKSVESDDEESSQSETLISSPKKAPGATCDGCGKSYRIGIEMTKHKEKCTPANQQEDQEPKQQASKHVASPSLMTCSYCQDLVSSRLLSVHKGKCAKIAQYVSATTCAICDLNFDSSREVYMHISEVHQTIINNSEVESPQLNESTREAEVDNDITEMDDNVEADTIVASDENSAPDPSSVPVRDEIDVSSIAISNERTIDNFGLEGPANMMQDVCYVGLVRKREPFTNFELNPNSNNPVIRYQQSQLVPNFGDTITDPRLVTKLYVCPMCFGKLAFFEDAQDHIMRFHRVSMQNLRRMGLSLMEETLS